MFRDQHKILAAGKLFGDFSSVKLIGQDAFGDLYEIIDLNTGEHSAMKTERLAVRNQAFRRV
jgi:hypothetical protein